MNTTRHGSARILEILAIFGALLTSIAVACSGQIGERLDFDATDSPGLASPLGLAFANGAFYTASPDGAALAITGKPAR